MNLENSLPKPILIRTPRDAENAACLWMRYWGFRDAELTSEGADGGIDIQSKTAVAQVKAEVAKTSRPVVQGLFGVANFEKKIPLYFSLGGYTQDAQEWADKAGIALFTFDLSGAAAPLNNFAMQIVEAAKQKSRQTRTKAEIMAEIDLFRRLLKTTEYDDID